MAKKGCQNPQTVWQMVSSHFVHNVEDFFFTLGVFVGRNPWKTIAITWLFIFISGIGLMRFHIEQNPMKLWVPQESDFYKDTNWYIEKFGSGMRMQRVLLTADNVLEPHILSIISNITDRVNSVSIEYNSNKYSLKNLCFEVPVVNFLTSSGGSVSSSDRQPSDLNKTAVDVSDPTLWLDYDFYCDFLKSFSYVCLRDNVLDVWSNKVEVIKNLTNHDISSNISTTHINPVTGHPIDYMKLLGGVKYDENGTIVSAESLMLTWYTMVNMTAVDLDEVGNLVGTEEWVSVSLAKWESAFIDLMEVMAKENKDIKLYYEAGRSFGDTSASAMFSELDKLFMGIFLMFVYIQFALSKCNWLEIRLTLGGIGLMSVGMSYISAVSWCSAFGISFGPVHSSLPFLLMGLGIDDMFVMKACWEQLSEDEAKKSLPHKIGLMLKHAGVSIVITSFTDIVALLIGAITILPSLQSFCIYAAVGVFFIFVYSVTFYVAVFTLDTKRIESNRNGVILCYVHKKPIKTSTSKSLLQKLFYTLYKNVIFTKPFKALVIIFTVVMTGFSVEAILKLEQRFDPKWFIPDGTYYKEFLTKYQYYYPDEGNIALVFLGEMEYSNEFESLQSMIHGLEKLSYVKKMSSWIDVFQQYISVNYKKDVTNSSDFNETDFKYYLSRFLYSPVGGQYQLNFQFEKPIQCGLPVSNIKASSIKFQLSQFSGPNEYIPAMNNLKHIVKSTNISSGDGYRSVWSKVFANWATDEVISVEVERNLELALLCVMVCTFILITNIQMCLWIFICVLLTIVNVLGWMQRWGMTVDVVCCIGLELAIGLCVDYAAHVGHTFLTIREGTRSERAFKTVTSIGTAVLLGGGSTLLSLSLLSTTKAYTFQAFFKIFLLVITFGLFNGLVFLPTMLSLVGPSAYKPTKEKEVAHPLEIQELNGKVQIQEKDNNYDDIS